MNVKIASLIGEYEGELPYFSPIGAYPLFYITEDNKVLCPKCANDVIKGEASEWLDVEPDDIVSYEVNWDNSNLVCENDHVIDTATIDLEEEEIEIDEN